MIEKQSNATEIQWTMVNPSINAGDQANRMLKQALPPDVAAHFATMRIANNKYIWQWKYDAIPLSKVSPEMADAAHVALGNIRQRIKGKLKERMSNVNPEQCAHLEECILTCPSDDYIFCYQDSSGQTDVIITGWGFVNPKAIDINPWEKVGVKKTEFQELCIGFQQDGELIPNRQFTLNNNGAVNTFTTDGSGYYHFEKPFTLDTPLTVTDINTSKTFNFQVTKGQGEYLFDVTVKTLVSVKVHNSGIPVANQQITIECAGNCYTLVTDGMGECSMMVTYIENNQVIASWAEEKETQNLSKKGNSFIFEVQQEPSVTPPIPSEPLSANVKVIDQAGNPIPGYPVIIEYPIGTFNNNTDDFGLAYTPPMVEGDTFVVRDGNNPDWFQEYIMLGQENEYVLMINNIPQPAEIARIRIVDRNNLFVTNAPVTFTQQGMAPMEGYINENGDCVVDKTLFIPDAPIQTIVNDVNRQLPPIMFSMSIDENDYLLSEEDNTPWWLILLEVFIALAVAVGLFFLCKAYLAGASGISDLVH